MRPTLLAFVDHEAKPIRALYARCSGRYTGDSNSMGRQAWWAPLETSGEEPASRGWLRKGASAYHGAVGEASHP